MLSRFIIAPFLILALVFLYLTLEVDSDYSWYIAPNLVIVAGLYVMSPQIDWWWYQRRPPKLPAGLVKMFLTLSSFFKQLSPEDKTKFCNRVALYMEANDFMAKGSEEVPPDVRAVIAASVVQLTFNQEDYLLNKYEHLIVYPHPFPSPQYQAWHSSEIYDDDGVIMFSAEQLMAGFAQPHQYFNIGLYEYARAFMRCHPEVGIPELGSDAWPLLQQVSHFTKDAVEKWIGLEDIDVQAVMVSHYFVFPVRFKAVAPMVFQQLKRVFG